MNNISKQAIDLLILRIQLKKARVSYGSKLRGTPCSISNKGKISIGNGNYLNHCSLNTCFPLASIKMGNNNLLNYTKIYSNNSVVIGNDCLLAGCQIVDNNSHNTSIDPAKRRNGKIDNAPIIIGNNVWIGTSSLILKGVHIGNNAIVGAGSILTKDVPDNCLFAGNPAKYIKTLTE